MFPSSSWFDSGNFGTGSHFSDPFGGFVESGGGVGSNPGGLGWPGDPWDVSELPPWLYPSVGWPGGTGGGSSSPGGSTSSSGSGDKSTADSGDVTDKEGNLDLKKILQKYGPMAAAILGGVMGGTMGSKQIQPTVGTPIFPPLQKAFGEWLMGGVGKGAKAYPGALNVNPAETSLPALWGQFNYVTPQRIEEQNKKLFQDQILPITSQIANQGGPAGPGLEAMKRLAATGVASPGSGGPLQAWANMSPQAVSQFLLPFTSGKGPNPYQAPLIGGR